jgi:dolichol-phosphate mannosyltransferase
LSSLAIVVPTLNERDNIVPLLQRLEIALAGIEWEVIFVDDHSPDGTADLVRTTARTNRRVRCVQRIGRRGLASACVEGVLASAAPFIAVMDADLQHDESILAHMLSTLKTDRLDVVIGSRYVQGGGVGNWDNRRQRISRFATSLGRLIVKADIADPMSGYFVFRREAFEAAMRNLSGQGFKILLDFFASSPRPLQFREMPFEFRRRQQGESKLDTLVAWEFIVLILDKVLGRYIPIRFLQFSIIGGLGLVVHLLTLWIVLLVGASFTVGQSLATAVAMVSNFALNNWLTYRDRRLKGWRCVKGLASFVLVCSTGAAANIGIATIIYRDQPVWWLAGVAGALTGAVWNYAVSSVFTWRSAK